MHVHITAGGHLYSKVPKGNDIADKMVVVQFNNDFFLLTY